MNILDLTGKVSLVTGAGQGVGRQIALHLAAHNARKVVVNDYYLDRAECVVDEIRRSGGAAVAVAADVSDFHAVKEMMKSTLSECGAIDVLINNAGNEGAVVPSGPLKQFWETGPEDWRAYLAVNLDGVFNCVAAVTPSMMERQTGRIITIVSDAGRVGEPGLEVYSGAKAGAAGFMRAIARSLGRYNISANCVSIAMTRTPRIGPVMDAMPPDQRKRALDKYVVRRFGEPEDVANMVLFLASDSSSWITGQTYPVNGGFSFGL
ncbi:SDR family NAD(P)-dependent oxidoreductase [Bradyrhizobium sp. AUGA SZCCT0431]|uniref:SDR family NAD(P)-dependent oxidoreductase n=1 Tax=Bradyrhizobium sp. AUGA SZCCT0431 TaxID=2807674 RepID=UPI001BA5306F|nr:SDR family NAD(P)-dependent oxidoreductase [Bradyrhizobium sp. AUGA SZCCT0431]MBR1146190.1 SDR family oxidoreductase [Bradyrhizobium sp. AUGA SZCCT0431]